MPTPSITLSPQFRLGLTDPSPGSSAFVRLRKAFAKSSAEGLFTLCILDLDRTHPSLEFWKKFATQVLEKLCKLPPTATFADSLPPPPAEDLARIILEAPPLPGGEYLSKEALEKTWDELAAWLTHSIADSGFTVDEWLKKNAQQWHQVGRVCFHLAENKNDPEYPFAFLATYAPRLDDGGRIQFHPLGQALKEYAGAKNKPRLLQLLEPVHRASQQIPFVKDLAETGDIYHPLAWTPEEAFTFLKSIPQLEAAGLLTRLPNWWKTRPRPKVSISLSEEKKPSKVGLNALLSFKMSFALGGQVISAKEVETLLDSSEGLVRLNGQWVEVDAEKLQQAIEHWKRVQTHAANGNLTFAQGMRLLAGAPRDFSRADDSDSLEAVQDWSEVTTSIDLEAKLKQLRNPQKIKQAASPHHGLKGTLRPYQEDGFKWLRLLTSLGLGACLADDMGLGKTIQVIALLLDQKHHQKSTHPSSFNPQPSLLVLPASLLANWKNEFATFAPSLRLCFIHPSENDHASLQAIAKSPAESLKNIDVVLTTYGMLQRQTWIIEQDWNLVIIDEAQAIKNPQTKQTRTVKRLKAHARIALTGTPIENSLSDLWSLFDFICPGLLGGATTFKKFCSSLQNGEAHRYAGLKQLVSPYLLRRLKTDKSIISDLPEKTELKAYCQLAAKQAALYKRTVETLAKDLREVEGMERKGLVLSYLMRFKQICNHPSQALGDNEYKPDTSGKFARLQELCEEIAARQEKVLIFTQFREMTGPIAKHLSSIFGSEGLVLHGGTPVSQRQKKVEAFQSPDGPPFFVLSLKAGGSGLTLTAASHVIHFDRWWNPAVENQATDRAYRIGQKRNVLVHKFVSRGTIEEKVDSLIQSKLALSTELLEGSSETNLTELSDSDLLNLVTLDIHTT